MDSIIGLVVGLFYLAFVLFMFAAFWKVFTKAGKPGWASLIPLYNTYVLVKMAGRPGWWMLLLLIPLVNLVIAIIVSIVLVKMAGRPGWWMLLFLIPLVNLVIAIIVSIDLAKAFGKGAGFGLGLSFLGFIFYPILGFGGANYQDPALKAA